MERIVEQLKSQHHCSTTRMNYYSIWKLFNNFYLRLDVKPGNWEDRLLLFVAHLIDSKKQSATVKSYISAVKAVLQEERIELNQDQFLISSMTRACKINNDQVTTKLPIYKGLLALLLNETNKWYEQINQPYLSILYKTLLLTAYFGLF